MKRIIFLATLGVAGFISAKNTVEPSKEIEKERIAKQETLKEEKIEMVCYQTYQMTSCGVELNNSGYCYEPGNLASAQAAWHCVQSDMQAMEAYYCGTGYNNGLGKDIEGVW
ncbi:hypothetical protein HNP38_000028 [Chryseobacterium defluvii]|uniref:Uncharacterized protein n=1 Tax=Chryseobacterium defluvii TaxID=160396 RepID=A0A840K6A7_9FLAO|nr:hypothetical protein [Chryseobacterium defluvii]MBB4804756.1 hypothetical protein [Chryseobacterium defluvii]